MTASEATMPDLGCGAQVRLNASVVTWDDAGDRYYFCSQDCRRAFVDSLGVASAHDSAVAASGARISRT